STTGANSRGRGEQCDGHGAAVYGDHCRYLIDAHGTQLIATSSQPLELGQAVSVNIDTQGVLAFA
ncbi:hypothetical protein, partial [Escherichia coli]|uniref:hypothetical protein n=1 Tax=Escherichia coli TaxID=562 RepID=UPI001BC8B34A